MAIYISGGPPGSHTTSNYSDTQSYDPATNSSQNPSSEHIPILAARESEEPSQKAASAASQSKPRRRQVHGPDHIKHRRTRSGCYTCRQRRVKCDEGRPVCERCRKGKRDCLYPEPNSKGAQDAKDLKGSGSSASEDEDSPITKGQQTLPSVPDTEEDAAGSDETSEPQSAVPATLHGHGSGYPSPPREQSPAPAVEPCQRAARTSRRPHLGKQKSHSSTRANPLTSGKWAQLPKDVRFYMKYHRDHLTNYHYAIKYDGSDFLGTTFLEIALGYEPLLYAVTAFAAYFHTIKNPNAKIQNFLQYYDKSVSLFRQSLSERPRHTVATLLTILQLATFEEYLGDWVNLIGHQKAAMQILTELFTPKTIMQSETHRKICAWYMRFDIVAGLMSGHEAALGREWFAACADFYARQARDKPNDIGARLEEHFSQHRLLAMDVALLFGKKAKGALSDDEFVLGLGELSRWLMSMEHELTTAFAESRTYIKDFPGAPDHTDPDDVVDDPTNPNFLLAGELFTWNFIMIDFWSLLLMFKSWLGQFDKSQAGHEVVDIAFKICRLFESLQYASGDDDAVVLAAQAALGFAATCLPKDQKHTMWCRRKYARIEACGYVYPTALRKRMSDLWNVDVSRWWLPLDEGYPRIMKSIREFIDYRTSDPQDSISADLRDMRGVFRALSLDDSGSLSTNKSTPAASGLELVEELELDLWTEENPLMNLGGAPDMSWK